MLRNIRQPLRLLHTALATTRTVAPRAAATTYGAAIVGTPQALVKAASGPAPRFFAVPAMESAHYSEVHPVEVSLDSRRSDDLTNNRNRYLTVDWSDGHTSEHAYIHLRDNCPCGECWHPTTTQRMNHAPEIIDVNVRPVKQSTSAKGDVAIEWTDGHKSVYTTKWLRDHCLELTKGMRLVDIVNWGGDFKIPELEYDAVMQDDKELLKWIEHLLVSGLVILNNSPKESGVLRRVGERIAYLKKTSYGEIFEVKSKANPSNMAYTNSSLRLHTDLGFYMYSPGVQMLHCISQSSEGGENTFVDGFNVAAEFKKVYPKEFHIMNTVSLVYRDSNEDAFGKMHNQWKKPVIQTDKYGRMVQFSYSNHARDHMLDFDSPDMDVHDFYDALFKLHHFMHDPKLRLRVKLQAGQLVAFGNERVLHGRDAYQMKEGDVRWLQGGYIDLDELRSKYRVIKKDMGDSSVRRFATV